MLCRSETHEKTLSNMVEVLSSIPLIIHGSSIDTLWAFIHLHIFINRPYDMSIGVCAQIPFLWIPIQSFSLNCVALNNVHSGKMMNFMPFFFPVIVLIMGPWQQEHIIPQYPNNGLTSSKLLENVTCYWAHVMCISQPLVGGTVLYKALLTGQNACPILADS